jgi:hypothetical protein
MTPLHQVLIELTIVDIIQNRLISSIKIISLAQLSVKLVQKTKISIITV